MSRRERDVEFLASIVGKERTYSRIQSTQSLAAFSVEYLEEAELSSDNE